MKPCFSPALYCVLLLSLLCSKAFGAIYDNGWSNNTIRYFYDSSDPLPAGSDIEAHFQWATQYLEDEIGVTFVQVDASSNIIPKLKVSALPNGARSWASFGMRPCLNQIPWLCIPPYVDLALDASREVVLHELFHVLGFDHEQVRLDRDNYIALDSDFLEANDSDYVRSRYNIPIGGFDIYSISLYRNHETAIIAQPNDDDNVFKLLKASTTHQRPVRITWPEATTGNSFDFPYLNTEQADITVARLPLGYTSGKWEFEHLGNNSFHIKNLWRNEQAYLVHDSSINQPAFKDISAITLSSDETRWRVEKTPGSQTFTLKNIAANQYIKLGHLISAAAGDTPDTYALTYSNTPENWILGMVTSATDISDDAPELSIMDKVAASWAYGHLFRLQLADGTDAISDNPTLNIEYGSLDVTPLPLDTNGNNQWHSAIWALERVHKYFMIRNIWTGEYLHQEYGPIAKAPTGTTNSQNVEVHQWHAAHWELITHGDFFRIKNRYRNEYLHVQNGQLTTTQNPVTPASNWDLPRLKWNAFE